MRVHPLKSISAKLFMMSFTLVLGTVLALAFKNSLYLEGVLENQVKDRSVGLSETSGRNIEATLETWQSQLLIVLQSVLKTPEAAGKTTYLESFIATSAHYVAVEVYSLDDKGETRSLTYGFTKEHDLFGNVDPDDTSTAIKKANAAIAKAYATKKAGKQDLFVTGLAKETALPLMTIGKLFHSRGQDVRFLMLLSVWQAPLIETLLESSIIKHVVLDSKGRTLLSRDMDEMKTQRSYRKLTLVQKALVGRESRGFAENYKGWGKTWLGGYYNISRYGLIVLVQQDTKSAYADIKRSTLQTLQWGALFVMFAVLLSYFGADSLTRNLRMVIQLTRRIAAGEFGSKLELKSTDEVALLSNSVNMMSGKIAHLLGEQVAQAEVKKDLEMAQAVQATLFPKTKRTQQKLRVQGFSQSASETGGDWWGHYTTEYGIEYVFVADAMGHGVPAALVTAVAYSSCMTLAHMLEDTKQIFTPGQILERVNRVLYNAVEGTISMTFFALMVDYHTGRITFANAGHNLPLLIPKDGGDDRIKKKIKSLQKISDRTPISLNVNGTILGVEKNATFKEQTMVLKPGDRFFLFSDGLIECRSPEGRQWQRKGMLEKVLEHIDQDLGVWLDGVKNDAYRFFADTPRDDDLTIVVVEFPETETIGGYRSDETEVVSNDTPAMRKTKVGAAAVPPPALEEKVASADEALTLPPLIYGYGAIGAETLPPPPAGQEFFLESVEVPVNHELSEPTAIGPHPQEKSPPREDDWDSDVFVLGNKLGA